MPRGPWRPRPQKKKGVNPLLWLLLLFLTCVGGFQIRIGPEGIEFAFIPVVPPVEANSGPPPIAGLSPELPGAPPTSALRVPNPFAGSQETVPEPTIAPTPTRRSVTPTPRPATTPAPQPSTPTVTATGMRKTIVELALSQLGKPYVWGGGRVRTNNPTSFDCSGLVWWVYWRAGFTQFPATTAAGEMSWGRRYTDRSQAQAGDLVIFQNSSGIDHIGIMMDTNRFIEATGSYGKVRISSFNPADVGQYRADLSAPGRVRCYVDVIGSNSPR